MRKIVFISVLVIIMCCELSIVQDIKSRYKRESEEQYRACVQKNYGMVPIPWYEENDLYTKCQKS